LTKAEAELNPVGEERNEPNRDPFLAVPIEGRGVGSRLGAMLGGFSLPSIGLPNMYKLALWIGIAVIVVIIGGFLLMFFKK
jgi:hypothetical protein